MDDALKTKLHFAVLILSFGRIRCIFEDLAFITKSSLTKIGVLNFKILNKLCVKPSRNFLDGSIIDMLLRLYIFKRQSGLIRIC